MRLEIQFLVFLPFTVVTVWQSVSPTPIFFKARLLQCLDFMFKNQILHRNSGFPTSLGKSEGLIMLGLEGHSLVCYSPRTHSLHSLTWSVQEAAGGEREGGPPRRCSVLKVKLPQAPSCPGTCGGGRIAHRPPLCAPDRRLYQDGTLKLLGRLSLLSEEILWAANGLPNPFCSSDHLCLLASFGMEVTAP